MRELDVTKIRDAVCTMVQEVNFDLPADVLCAIKCAKGCERNERAAYILDKIEDNIQIAGEERIPLCQDTGLACVFLEVGQDVMLTGGYLYDAINEGVRRGYEEGYLRKSVVADPLRRVNTKDNTPAHIHVDIVPGDQVKVTVAPKGFGSENMSRVKMFPPSAGEEGVKEFVLETVRLAGGNPCPPIVLGVGIGGTFDGVALLAKKALMLPVDHQNEDPYYAAMEEELLAKINETGIGPQGFGGDTTALGINILTAPTHIAGLPVAVNVNCHVSRHKEVIL
ncbi:MAG: fumarate hydratase [Firmicutes bacterium]|nr:fumarate hydratase [Bacillota bacterium]